MKSLVLGGTGHTGALLAEKLLENGHDVSTLAFDNRPALQRLAALGIPHHHIDLSSPADWRAAFSGVELVFNLAARVSYRDRDWSAVHPVNVAAAGHVVQACLQYGVRRLVHFSSIDVFSGEPPSASINEQSPLVPENFHLAYPRSKRQGQQLVTDAAARGLETLLLYPTSIIGPFDHAIRSSNRILLLQARGEMPVLLDAGLTVIDVRDVVDFTVRAATAAAPGSAYVLTGPWAHFRDFARLLQPLTGKKHFPVDIPFSALRLIAPISSRLSEWTNSNSPMTLTALHGLSHYRHVSSEKAMQDFGFQPRPLADTVRDAYYWFEQQGFLHPQWKWHGGL